MRTPVFDQEKLKELIRHYYEITKIHITVYSTDSEVLAEYPETNTPICALIQSSPAGSEACSLCRRKAFEEAAVRQDAYIFRCHAGLTEAVTALRFDSEIVGFLVIGQVVSYDSQEEGRRQVLMKSRRLPLSIDQLERDFNNSEMYTKSYLQAAVKILYAISSYLVMERIAFLNENHLSARLETYVEAHYTDKISAEMIQNALGIGKTQLYQVSKQLYGCGVMEQVNHMRMDLAKHFLAESPSMTLSEIASSCGFKDYNYFISTFAKSQGMTPGNYRRSCLAQEELPSENDCGMECMN